VSLLNNYANDLIRKFGKIPMSALLSGTFDPSIAQDLGAVATHGMERKQIAWLRAIMDALPAAFPSERRDLVMGFALGYPVATIRPFVESLFTAGAFLGKAVLFVKPEDTELTAYLRSRGITVVFFNAQAYPVANPMVARWFAYFDYLRSLMERGKCYRYILLTDVRDVIFQKPLFGMPCGELEFQYEAASPTIGECSWNSLWIRECFGEETLARFADRRISCAGTVSGRMRGILRYLALMQMLILGFSDDIKQKFGGDQGVHNYILHSGFLAEAKALDNFERVATLNYVSGAEVHPDNNGCVVNPNGTISEIAHQWDRHPHLTAAILARALKRQKRSDQPFWQSHQYLRNLFTRIVLPWQG
jgi:hypothetical protein